MLKMNRASVALPVFQEQSSVGILVVIPTTFAVMEHVSLRAESVVRPNKKRVVTSVARPEDFAVMECV